MIGTARAFEISHSAGAFASLGMGLTGVFTALILPLVSDYKAAPNQVIGVSPLS